MGSYRTLAEYRGRYVDALAELGLSTVANMFEGLLTVANEGLLPVADEGLLAVADEAWVACSALSVTKAEKKKNE